MAWEAPIKTLTSYIARSAPALLLTMIIASFMQYYRILDGIYGTQFYVNTVFKVVYFCVFFMYLYAFRLGGYKREYSLLFSVFILIYIFGLLRGVASSQGELLSSLMVATTPIIFLISYALKNKNIGFNFSINKRYLLTIGVLIAIVLIIESAVRYMPSNYGTFQNLLDLQYLKTSYRLSGTLYDQNRWAILMFLLIFLVVNIELTKKNYNGVLSFTKNILYISIIFSGSKISIFLLLVYMFFFNKIMIFVIKKT